MRVTRLRRLRCREANTLGVRSAYPLASACCAAVEWVALTQPTGSLRTSAHTGVAIRIPLNTHYSATKRLGERIATPGDVGHWLAMTGETLKTYATTRLPSSQIARYSMSVMCPPQFVQYNRVRGSSAEHATDGPKSR